MNRNAIAATVTIICCALLAAPAYAANVVVWDVNGHPDMPVYVSYIEQNGFSVYVTDDIVDFYYQHGRGDADALFVLTGPGEGWIDDDEQQVIEDVYREGCGVYFEDFPWADLDWMWETFHFGLLTCDTYPFWSFSGVDYTIMEGLHYSFAEEQRGGNLGMDLGFAEDLFVDDVNCGCVMGATTDPMLRAAVSDQPLMTVLDGDPPNTKAEMIRRLLIQLGALTGIEETRSAPEEFALSRVYPNPFNARTTIEFSTGAPGEVEISVYDITGRKVGELFRGFLDSGRHRLNWNASGVSSGTYFWRITTGDGSSSGRMVLLK